MCGGLKPYLIHVLTVGAGDLKKERYKRIRGTLHPYCWESHRNTKLHHHKVYAEDLAQTHPPTGLPGLALI